MTTYSFDMLQQSVNNENFSKGNEDALLEILRKRLKFAHGRRDSIGDTIGSIMNAINTVKRLSTDHALGRPTQDSVICYPNDSDSIAVNNVTQSEITGTTVTYSLANLDDTFAVEMAIERAKAQNYDMSEQDGYLFEHALTFNPFQDADCETYTFTACDLARLLNSMVKR